MDQTPGFIAAVEEAKLGYAEGGVPIGAALVSKDGQILGRGHNMRVQKGSPVLHVCEILRAWVGTFEEISSANYPTRPKCPPWKTPAACPPLPTKEQLCIPLCHPVTCALVHACSIR